MISFWLSQSSAIACSLNVYFEHFYNFGVNRFYVFVTDTFYLVIVSFAKKLDMAQAYFKGFDLCLLKYVCSRHNTQWILWLVNFQIIIFMVEEL
jgi:hypothetical protein